MGTHWRESGYLDAVGSTRHADFERTKTLWFALLLTLTNGFIDAYTYFTRGGVFANVQTGNIILFAVDISEAKLAAAMAHVWSLLAFIIGIALASHIKSGRAERLVPRPLLWTMAVQAVALLIIGFVPLSVPNSLVTIPICFLAAVQIGLFRNIGELAYFPVATTGNLMRFVEAGYDGFVEKSAHSRRAFSIYGALITTFTSGAVIGALASRAWFAHAIWLPAGCLALTCLLIVLGGRRCGDVVTASEDG